MSLSQRTYFPGTTDVPGTFCTKSHVSGPMIRIPSDSVTANVEPG